MEALYGWLSGLAKAGTIPGAFEYPFRLRAMSAGTTPTAFRAEAH